MRPGEGVAEGGVLAGEELAEVDDVLREQVFVLPGQADVVQAGIVGVDDYVHPGGHHMLAPEVKFGKMLPGVDRPLGAPARLQAPR